MRIPNINGILIVDKPIGMSSHDVVSFVRRLTGVRRVGHTGTLDPMATGVLPVCIGVATKVTSLLQDADKVYRAELVLGMTTDTYDCEGEVLTECAVNCTKKEIIDTILTFQGEQEQIPPMYSAIKKDGKRLYELAREGKQIERTPRPVQIHSIELLDIELPYFKMRVHCGKGTYIRSLCRDIGEKIGCGACMDKLCRTKVGRFDIEDAMTLEHIQELKAVERLADIVIPVDAMFEGYRAVEVPERYSALIKNGNRVRQDICSEKYTPVRMYCDGVFYGIYELDCGGREYYPVKMFISGEQL